MKSPPEKHAAWLESIRVQNPALATDLQTLLKERRALGEAGFLKTGAGALPRRSPLIEQTIGAYALEAPIGRGGMGTVWLARRSDGRFEGRAAVKFLNAALLGGAGEERFKREGSFLARLAHPLSIYEVGVGRDMTARPPLSQWICPRDSTTSFDSCLYWCLHQA